MTRDHDQRQPSRRPGPGRPGDRRVPDGDVHADRADRPRRRRQHRRRRSTVEATGDLTIHGVTTPVTLPLEAQLVDDTIVVVGSLDIALSTYGVEAPSAPIVVSVVRRGDDRAAALLLARPETPDALRPETDPPPSPGAACSPWRPPPEPPCWPPASSDGSGAGRAAAPALAPAASTAGTSAGTSPATTTAATTATTAASTTAARPARHGDRGELRADPRGDGRALPGRRLERAGRADRGRRRAQRHPLAASDRRRASPTACR